MVAGTLLWLDTAAVTVLDSVRRACAAGEVALGTLHATARVEGVVVGAGALTFSTVRPFHSRGAELNTWSPQTVI